MSLNVRRRHLSTIDRAQLALLIKPKFEAQAAERVKAQQAKPGEKANARVVAPVPLANNQDLIAKKGRARM